MADIDLPVFSFRPNWANGVNERLTFLTQVLRGEEGAEQRRPLRLTPRRLIEADYLLSGPERTFYDLFMHKLGATEIMVPLYWDIGRLGAVATAGVTDRLEFDTRWTEFVPGLAIIQGSTAMNYEVVEITAVDDDGIDLADPVVQTWPKRSVVMPIRRSLIEDMGSLGHVSAAVATISAQFALVVSNPWTPADDDSVIYDGLPVMLEEPNWVESLDAQLARDAVRFDNQSGLPYQTDPTGRANVGQAHRWFLYGRERLAKYRDLLYRNKGRTGSFWLPTFKSDLKLAASALSGSTQIVVENVGLNYCNVPTSGRDHLAIHLKNGTTILREILDVDPGTTPATEKVDLDSAVGLALSPGQVRKISFLDTARFDQDEFDLQHFTDSKGYTEATAVFRTFKNSRVPATPISYDIPATEMTNGACGIETIPACYAVPEIPSFEGWYVEFLIEWGLGTLPPVVPRPAWLIRGNNYGTGANAGGLGYTSGDITNDDVARTITVRNYAPNSYNASEWRLQQQFGAFTLYAPPAAYGRWSARRWDDVGFTVLNPKTSSALVQPGYGSTWGLENPWRERSLYPIYIYADFL